MPQPGETITEGTIVNWIAKVGDKIHEGQMIVELETEKAVFEYESPYEGKLLEILEPANKTVPVGNPIALFEVEEAKANNYSMLGIGKKTGDQKTESKPQATMTKPISPKGPAKTSPLIRRLMQEYHIEPEALDFIEGTGPGGRITKENLQTYLANKKNPSGEEDVVVEPCSPVRVRIAEHMVKSKKIIPHAHISLSVDVTRVVEHRERVKEAFKKQYGIGLGYLPLLFPALKKAILRHPLVNASFREEQKSMAIYKKINLGIAVGLEKGLFIPVIHHAEKMNYLEFAKEADDLLGRANSGKLTVTDLTGVTFTFNNYGFYGTTIGVQIILPPQSSTLGMGVIQKRSWVVGDEIKIRHVSDLTLAFDHRLMDGRDAGLFLLSLKKSLENFSENDLAN